MMKHLLSLTAALCAVCMNAQTTVGYTNGQQGRDYIFRTGTTETGLAILLPQSKTQMLEGRKITALQYSIGTKNAVDKQMTLFVGPDVDNPIYTQTATIASANKWVTVELDQPYLISGDEPLYIGYTATMMNATYNPLSADKTLDLPGACIAFDGKKWTDLAGDCHGCANLRAVLDDGDDFTDILVKPFQISGYFKAGQKYTLSSQLYNFGTVPVSDIQVTFQAGDGSPVTTTVPEAIAPGTTYDLILDDCSADQSGELPLSVTLEVADDDSNDNASTVVTYFYPQDMERSILLEGFTGQACSNCPRGHREINEVVEGWTGDDIVEISHHAGYQPDQFTMAEDYDYTYFYQGSMYAPAVAVNRLKSSESNLPIFNCSTQGITDALHRAAAREPYVSLEASSTFDPATRDIKVTVNAYTHRDLPTPVNAINVALCQNGIKAFQSNGGSEYVHNSVFRGCLTGNSWGVKKDFLTGSNETLVIEKTLPESIFSTYYDDPANLDSWGYKADDVTWAIDPENMYLVAYVAAFDENDVNGHNIYNCVSIPLNGAKTQGGFSGVEELLDTPSNAKPVYYDLTGRRINEPAHGIYIRVQGDKATKIKL